ncbi:BTAD domain-containing putative transcriptional regulator [Actinoplanes sichuanensis]|uniref:BTAD domain-containing putative transcriptional regulator n=1 Tax=Actinoplanes sichuanensis TaxID=512349 RepID=A0ABW4AMX2_9ACTN|nr:BTAD domain-containing putative transcriptional regulator [Actinoplanes sichuanensis]BEL08295.1 BTAD domain-containing putative transcriptional regulator [Actinoplanes sichuanensis]
MSGDGDRLRVGLLGALRVTRGGAELPITGARLRGLIVRLAVAAGRPVAPGLLVEALWPQEQPADPANALQSLISRLRRQLGGGDTVAQAEGGYRLAVEPDDVDVHRFARLAAAGRECLRAGDPAGAAGPLGAAAALAVAGTVAPELTEVAPAQAVRVVQDVIETVADLGEAEIALGLAERAAGRLTGLLAEHPLNERLAALLIDALTVQGRQADALAVYERVRAALGDQLGADPGAALRERHLHLLRGTTPSTPHRDVSTVPPRVENAADPPPTNLPEPLTSFVGRADDLARIDALLDAGRLVTVLGPGGAGKTRLAVEAARRRAGAFRDGVWLVDLASVTEAAKVGAAVVASAGLRGSALFETVNRVRTDGRGDVDVLAERLYGRQILLLIDNCEHVIDAVAHLISALLVRCPRLRVLATSREPLAVDGESLVPLGPLGLPAATAGATEAAGSPAVRLFVERAAAVRPDFTIDDETAGDVVRIVRGLDGLPLALELAAARLRTLGLTELAVGLSDRFRLLTSGNRTAQPRHRTLRAVITWSWNLLADDERDLAERIAVLPGGVTVSSATAISGSGVSAADLLAALVDRSLLQLAPGGRYRMLETIREYGIERLAEQGTLGAVRDLAARHLAALVSEYDARLRTVAQVEALRTMRAEYDNTLAALRHFCDVGDARAALSLALDLGWYWQMFGRHADAAYWLAEALAVPGDADPVAIDSAEAILVLNRTGHEPGLLTETAAQRRDRVRALADRLAAHPELPGPAGAIAAFILYFAGDNELAEQRVNRLIDGPDRWLSAMAHMMRAQIAENNGDVEQMGRDAALALDGFRALGDRWGQATVLPLRALVRQYDGDLDGALGDLRAARALAFEFGSLDIADEIFIDLRWADLHMRRGEPNEARAALAQARGRAERSDSGEMRLLVDALEAGMMIWLGDLDRATELIDRAAAGMGIGGAEEADMRLLLGGDHGCAIVGAVRASLAVRQGDPDTAEKALAVAYPAAVQTQDMPILALVAVAAGGLAVQRGRSREAAALLGAAARLRGAHDHTALDVITVATRARAVLGEEGFGEAYAVGWNLETAAAQSLIDPARLALESGPS